MEIRANNQHDYYAHAVNNIIIVQQLAASFVKLHEALSKCSNELKEAMIKELEDDERRQ